MPAFATLIGMDDEFYSPRNDLADDLCQFYREMERTRSVHLDICELMLSSSERSRREWVQIPGHTPPEPKKE